MKKSNLVIYVFLLLASWFLIGYNVEAKNEKVSIKSITLEEKSEKVTEVKEATFKDLSINLNLKFKAVGDYAKYKVVIDNKENEEYTIGSMPMDDYLEYEVSNTKIKPKKETTLYLTVKYKKDVPTSELNKKIDSNVNIALVNKDGKLINPTTGSILVLLMIAILVGGMIFAVKNKKIKLFVLTLLMLTPFIVHAAIVLKITVNTKYEVNSIIAYLDTGKNINTKLKKRIIDETYSEVNYTWEDDTIVSFQRVQEADNSKLVEENIVSTSKSHRPVYMWVEDDTIYFYSEADAIYLNEDSSYMFYDFCKLSNIEGAKYLNTSKVTNMDYMFACEYDTTQQEP